MGIRIASHHIASHHIASHHIASHRIAVERGQPALGPVQDVAITTPQQQQALELFTSSCVVATPPCSFLLFKELLQPPVRCSFPLYASLFLCTYTRHTRAAGPKALSSFGLISFPESARPVLCSFPFYTFPSPVVQTQPTYCNRQRRLDKCPPGHPHREEQVEGIGTFVSGSTGEEL